MSKHCACNKLLVSVFVCHLAGVLGAIFSGSSVSTWYVTLVRPAFAPPSWVFGPVWLCLYTLMGIALYLIWNSKQSPGRDRLLVIFGIHLIYNALWSIIFFGFQNILGAFVCIIILWGMIAYLIKKFEPINKLAAWLLVPYLLWVGFATVLNLAFWILN